MAYIAYVRCSSVKSDVENQRFEIERWANHKGIEIDEWVVETVSGVKDPDKRKLGEVIKRAQPGDTIICTEISRLGRSLFIIMDVLHLFLEKGVYVNTIKDRFTLDDSISAKILAFAFGLSAEIERQLISQRTKEALAKKKAEGITLGRPKGSFNKTVKLSGKEDAIRILISEGHSYSKIARLLHCDRSTLTRFIKNHMSVQENPNYPATKNDIEKTVV